MKKAVFYHNLLKETTGRFPSYPEGRFRGRGIVLCAGGVKYLSNAYVCMKMLREYTDLPIELFHAGKEEMPDSVRKGLLEQFAPICIRDISKQELPETEQLFTIRHFRGYHIKPYALLYSSFEEVFFIDADNMTLHPPEVFFDSDEFRRFGAIFWPDLRGSAFTKEPLCRVFGFTRHELNADPEFESGQIFMDKRRCWRALLTVCLVNSDLENFRNFCYRHTLGDKDTFRLAFRFTETPYRMVPHYPLRLGNLFVKLSIPLTDHRLAVQHDIGSFYSTGQLQHDFAGIPAFVHKTESEWDMFLDFRNLGYVEGLDGAAQPSLMLTELENRGYRYLYEFRERYFGSFDRVQTKEIRKTAIKMIMRGLDMIHRSRTG